MARAACVVGVALCCLSSATAWAQDKGDTGLTIAAPSAIGIIWHPSERLAIRPDLSFGFSGTDGEGSLPDLSSNNVSFGVSALWYTHRWDDLRIYVSPRVGYGRGSTDFGDSSGLGDASTSTWSFSGSMGGQYALGTRFGVFAEAGLGYSSQSSEAGPFVDRTTWTFGTRTAIGGILYF